MVVDDSDRGGFKELRGNLHIHTDKSDGTLPVEAVAKLARKAKLDFIGVTDHFAPCGPAYYRQGLLILRGTELNKIHSHYLAYGCESIFPPRQEKGPVLAQQVKNDGGFGVIAHPYERGSPIVSGGKCYPWVDWDSTDFQALEIWNLTSQWRDSARSYRQSIGQWLFRRYLPFASGACPHALAKWDSLCGQRHVSGLAGSDIHAPQVKIWRFRYRVLGYSMLLKAVNTYCLAKVSGRGEEDGAAVIAALKAGRCWIAYDRLALGRGFSFTAESDNCIAQMGGTVSAGRGKIRLHVELPRVGEVRLLQNGALLTRAKGSSGDFTVSIPGVYRLEVSRKGIPWIYSNPIYIVK